MLPAQVFSIVGLIAMLMWGLMILLPKWNVTQFLIRYKVAPIIFAVIYTVYIVLSIQAGGNLDFGSLGSVMSLFTKEEAVLAGWVHYLAFDLLVGMWMLNQNKTIGIHQLLMAPCLFATFMLGPVGFLLFIIIKTIKKQ